MKGRHPRPKCISKKWRTELLARKGTRKIDKKYQETRILSLTKTTLKSIEIFLQKTRSKICRWIQEGRFVYLSIFKLYALRFLDSFCSSLFTYTLWYKVGAYTLYKFSGKSTPFLCMNYRCFITGGYRKGRGRSQGVDTNKNISFYQYSHRRGRWELE